MKKPLSYILNKEISDIQAEVYQKRLIQAVLGVGAVGLLSTAIGVPNQPKQNIAAYLFGGSILSFAAAYWEQHRTDTEAKYQSYLALDKEHYKDGLARAYDKNIKINTIAADVELIQIIENQLPVHAQMRYVQQFNLQGLMQPQLMPSGDGGTTTTLDISLQQQINELESKHEIDLSWLDDDFVNSSKIVVGGRGSGKSVYLRYQTSRWLLQNPGGILRICDPHYDITDKSKWWLNDINQDYVAAKYVSKKRDDIFAVVAKYYQELKDRIENGMTDDHGNQKPRIHIVFDEIENLKRGDKEQFKMFLDFIETVQDEGRKFDFDITLAMHSLKKENTGVDSATTAQMNWLLFDRACYDANTKYPSDFDTASIRANAKQLGMMTPRNVARVAVIVKQELYEPMIIALPLLVPPVIQISQSAVAGDSGDVAHEPEEDIHTAPTELYTDEPTPPESTPVQEAYQILINWVNSVVAEYNRYPAPENIKQAWFDLTKQQLSEQALVYLIDKLYDDTSNPD